MATRSIVTSQPDVACDVCERRLLRGEQPDVFLDAGEPRMVCELCAPRAAHQGWKRGSAEHALGSAPLRTRRGRGLFERLRTARAPVAAQGAEQAPSSTEALAEGSPYDFLTVDATAGGGPELDAPHGEVAGGEQAVTAPVAPAGPLQQALDVFNAGAYPRRVASLARSLGQPEVSVREGEAVASSIIIVIAWELCWYTYEVDLDNMQGAEAHAIAQGTELGELRSEDRLANALADERGALVLS